MKKLFGTDGIRGVANRDPMTPELALSLGQAVARYFSGDSGSKRIVIGKDTRRSSYLFEYALCAGLSSMGMETILFGPIPTPAVAWLTQQMKADAGIMISASHNSFEDNGIKFFDSRGFKLPDEAELEIEKMVMRGIPEGDRPTGGGIGRANRIEEATEQYVNHLKSVFPKSANLKGFKIVLDCANGAAYKAGPQLLEDLDAMVYPIGVHPDGTNINKGCGSMYPQAMIKRVIEEGAHLGIALDGDADRVLICDEKGDILDGDQILALCALDKLKHHSLNKNTVVGTLMTNMGLEQYLKKLGVSLIRTKVGDRYIIEEMKNNGYVLGGEPSGHIILMDKSTTGDGLLAALNILALMSESGKPLSQLVLQMNLFPQRITNIRVKEKRDLAELSTIKSLIKSLEADLASDGRIILRYSGTEPLLRLMVEAKEEHMVESCTARLEEVLREQLC